MGFGCGGGCNQNNSFVIFLILILLLCGSNTGCGGFFSVEK
ncbi:hypothetical protein [Desulforamulus aeronauticus]|uniref:Uncharacterized protein n=1 Tax=Desulforamulus aeronauticus DSM 10349 TaxID=1121421 RepID=A0A1M6WK81_9FIRM|nr:hypothetical protein [Desulforamulus aeronauticus]SHK93999.1 hypothetical protein SAMN02745123_03664 [Desulforamulus aeronauticus DSM 10349]